MLPYLLRQLSAERWQPAADVYRTDQGWIIKLEAAGIRPEDLQVLVGKSRLTIRGRRVDRQIASGATCHRLEIAYCGFERQIDFPVELTTARIETDYRDGMLLIRILTEEARP